MSHVGRRARQLWHEVKTALDHGHFHADQEQRFESGAFASVRDVGPPPFTVGEAVPLPRGRSAESSMERFFENAGHTLVTHGSSIRTTDEMHRLLLRPASVKWFSCALWAVLLVQFHSVEADPEYTAALFLNMALCFTTLLLEEPALRNDAVARFDVASCIGRCIAFTLRQTFPVDEQLLSSEEFAMSIERDVMRWSVGVDGMERGALFHHNHSDHSLRSTRPTSAASNKSVLSASGVPGSRDASQARSTAVAPPSSSPLQERLRAASPSVPWCAGSEASRTPQPQSLLQRALHGAPCDVRAPFVSRSVAMKRAGGGEGSGGAPSAGEHGAVSPAAATTGASKRDASGRTSIEEIHRRVQLAAEARREVLDRARELEAQRQIEMLQQRAREEDYALSHMIRKDEWGAPLRHNTRSFALDAVSPLVKLFLVATSQSSSALLTAATVETSVMQRQPATALHRLRFDFRVPHKRLPWCSRCGTETIRVQRMTGDSDTAVPLCFVCGTDARSRPATRLSSADRQRANVEEVEERHTPNGNAAFLMCPTCQSSPICRQCVSERFKAPPVAAVETNTAMLFGPEMAQYVWTYFPQSSESAVGPHGDKSAPPVANAALGTRRSRASRLLRPGTIERWHTLVMELLERRSNSTPQDALKFDRALREANLSLGHRGNAETKAAVDDAVGVLLSPGDSSSRNDAEGDMVEPINERGSIAVLGSASAVATSHGFAPMQRPWSANGRPPPATRPESAQGSRSAAASAAAARVHRNSAAPVVDPSPCSLSFSQSRNRPQSACSLRERANRQGARAAAEDPGAKAPLGAFLTGVAVSHGTKDPIDGVQLLSRPTSAASRRPMSAASSRTGTPNRRPSSAAPSRISFLSTTSLYAAKRASSPSIGWTVTQPEEANAAQRFAESTKEALRESLARVRAITAQSAAAQAAHDAGAKQYQANISRYAVEYLQEVKRSTVALRNSEKSQQRDAMAAVTNAVEAAAAKQHHPLRKIDVLKDALYAIERHFDDLPEAFRQHAIKYTGEQTALLKSLIRSFKQTNRDRSQWPASLDDLHCSRTREPEVYGDNAVYRMSPQSSTRKGSVSALKCNSELLPPPPPPPPPELPELRLLDGESDGAAISTGGGAQLTVPSLNIEPDSGDDDMEVDVHAREILAAMADVTQKDASQPPPSTGTAAAHRSTYGAADGVARSRALPPKCIPAVPVGGSSTLVSRSGVLMWDDTDALVGQQAADVRVRHAEKQATAEPLFPYRVEIVQ